MIGHEPVEDEDKLVAFYTAYVTQFRLHIPWVALPDGVKAYWRRAWVARKEVA